MSDPDTDGVGHAVPQIPQLIPGELEASTFSVLATACLCC